ncbi:MAG: BACON domain-containing protein [Phocaeicola sp.]
MKFKNYLWLISMALFVGLSLTLTACGDPDPDEVSVSMPSVNFDESGGSMSIQVMSNTNWTVSGNPGWLTIAPMQGSGNGAFSITANANTEKSSRNCVLYINAGSASTMVTVNQSGKVQETKITITNNSSYSFYRFTVLFMNSRMESIEDRDFGTLTPGQTITCDIPSGATEFCMAMYSTNNGWLFTANYDVSNTNISLTNNTSWYTSSPAKIYPKTSQAN